MVSLLLWGGMIVGCVIFLAVVWRAMKATESIAKSLRRIADKDITSHPVEKLLETGKNE